MAEELKMCSNPDCEDPLKPLSSFNRRSRSVDGLTSRCKNCLSVSQKKFRENNPEKVSGWKKEYRKRNLDESKNKDRRYRENNREKIQAYLKEWRNDPENKEKLKNSKKAYHEKNKDLINQRSRQWRLENQERARESKRKWAKENPDRVRASLAKREALKSGLSLVENVSYSFLYKRDTACYLCGVDFLMGDKLHVDHKIPLSRLELGPTHSYENLAVTHAKCNLQKSDMTPEEYWTSLGVNL